jgi:chromosome segregation ATPase
MKTYFASLIVMIATLLFSWPTAAQEHVDAVTDAEEVTADSEATVTYAKEAAREARKEREENVRALREANHMRAVAEAKRDEAARELKKKEAEVHALLSKQSKIKGETEKFNQDVVSSEEAIQEGSERVEKTKAETETLEALHAETVQKLEELKQAKEALDKEVQAVEQQKMQAQLKFQQIRDEENLEARELEKAKAEAAQNKLRTEEEIAQLKERYQAARTRINEMEETSAKLKQEAAQLGRQQQVARDEVQVAEGGQPPLPPAMAARAPTFAANEEILLKHDCKIYDGPGAGAHVIGMKFSGTPITNPEEQQGWIAFPLSGAQKGFVAKGCL